jgi:hypothetical protein
MTEEERQAFLMFAGTMHGQARATDQMLVGQSNNLRPISNDIQTRFAQVLQTPPNQYQPFEQSQPPEPNGYHQPPHPDTFVPSPANYVGIEQAAQELADTQSQRVSVVDINSNIVDVLKDINLNIERVASILEKQYGRQKRTKITKST